MVATAKKAVAKKVTAKPRAITPKPAKSTDGDASDAQVKETVEKIASIIKSGKIDGHLVLIDDALTERVNINNRVNVKKAAAAAPKPAPEKKVAPAPKRETTVDETVGVDEPVANAVYLVAAKLKQLAGAKVKFIRFKADDTKKSVVEMVTDKPGFPKGKRTIIPTASLTEVPKAPAKKVARKK